VINVEKGWRGFSEIDRVTYDSEQINVKQMENLLKRAGTYIRTVPPRSTPEESGR
jgi:hypothetical protein